MTDRELLELAAKAGGIEVIRSRLEDPLNMDMLVKDSSRNIAQVAGTWNPLTDDGDALRLAVKLKIDLIHFTGHLRADVKEMPDTHQMYGDDPYEATRRAIVKAAAEIGRAM